MSETSRVGDATERRIEQLLELLEGQGIKPGLAATRSLLTCLGNPERELDVVLVAGTNGKGSTATLLASMAAAAGYHVGLYTSPHLEEPRERIRIDGRSISRGDLLATLERIVAASDRTPTYFEAMTIAAFVLFDEAGVDLAVVEVGLGGRLDATNVADPFLSIVTSIGLDHTDRLGDTLAEIAGEKAGVFRKNRPALWGPMAAEADARLREVAAEVGAAPWVVDDADSPMRLDRGSEGRGQRVELEIGGDTYEIEIRLEGAHQAANARLAVAAAVVLRRSGFDRLDRSAIERGAASAFWPGRLEVVERPDRPGYRLLLDAAHNPAAVESLVAVLQELGEPFDLLFGALRDKPAAEMLGRLAPRAARVIVTKPDSPRAWWPEEVPAELDVDRIGSPAVALESALADRGGSTPRLLVVTGSIFLVGPLRRELSERWPEVVLSAARCDVTRGPS